jgi:NUMOD3 motif-containing protein
VPTGVYERTAKTRRILSKAHRGKRLSAEHREKVRLKLIGRPVSDATKAKMSATQRGRRLSREHRAKLSAAAAHRRRQPRGAENGMWRGDEASYSSLHKWVRKWKGKPTQCEHCGATDCALQWANVSGDYRRHLDDFISLCVPCHTRFDRRRSA